MASTAALMMMMMWWSGCDDEDDGDDNDNDNGDDKEDIDNVCPLSFSAPSRAWLDVFLFFSTKSGCEVTDILDGRTRWVVKKFWTPKTRCQVEVAAWGGSCRWVSGVKTSFVPGCLDNKWQRMIFMCLIGFVTFLALLLILCCGIFLLIWNTNYRLLGHFQFSRQVGTGTCKKVSGRILVSRQALETRWRALHWYIPLVMWSSQCMLSKNKHTKKPWAIFFLSMIFFPLFMVTTQIMQWMMVWRRWWWCDDNYDEHDGTIDDYCDDNGDNDDDRVEGANMQAATSSHLQSRLHNLQYFISIIFIIFTILSNRRITIFIIKKTEPFSSDDHRYNRKTQPEDFNEPFCYFTWVYMCITLMW